MSELAPLIQDLALILITAAIVTIIFRKIKQPLVLGYIVAGFLISPYFSWAPTVVDTENIQIWSDIGVIFLLFAIGLEFSIKKLMKVGGPATIAAIIKISAMMIIGYFCGQFLGWSAMDSIFLGGIICMSSTMIIVKAFDDLGLKTQKFTGIVIGILIIEDIVAVLMMVLLSTIATGKQLEGFDMGTRMISVLLKLGFFLVLWFILGIFLIPSVLKKVRSTLTDEMLLVVASGLCFGMVIVAENTGFSYALGAFVMGSLLAETLDAEKIEHLVRPLKDFFGAIFFVSVGMMVNPSMLMTYAFPIFVIVLAVVFGKLIFSTLGILLSGQPLKIAVEAGFSLPPIGEFAFIIAGLGLSLGVTGDFLYPVVVAVSVVTTFITPYSIKAADPVFGFLDRHMPGKVRFLLDQYSSGIQTADRESEWKTIIKDNLKVITIYSVILTAIIVISDYVGEIVLNYIPGIPGTLLIIVPTFLVMAPFLNALLRHSLRTDAFNTLWEDKKYSRGPLVSLIIFRVMLAAFFVSVFLMKYIRTSLVLLVLLVLLILVFIYVSKKLSLRYTDLEKRFMTNFNARENNRTVLRKEKMTETLLSKDMHFGNFDVSADSEVVGKSLKELNFRKSYGVNIVSIIRGVSRINIPDGEEVLYPLDRLIVLGSDSQLRSFKEAIEKEKIISEESGEKDVVLQQFSIGSNSPILGKSIRDSAIRSNGKCLVVGIEEENGSDLILDIDHKFVAGDVIWIVGEKERIDAVVGKPSGS